MKAKSSPIEILVFGTGAVGSTLAWRLAQNPLARLSVICRSNYDAVRTGGITLNTKIWGNGHFMPHRVVRSPLEVSRVPFDYVICSNKVSPIPDDDTTARSIASVVSPRTVLVTAQNGVGVETPLRRTFHNNTILSAICYISCLQPVPGYITQPAGIRAHAFHIGTFDSRSPRDETRLAEFVRFDKAFQAIEDVQQERWCKQIFNGAWNPVTAISGLDTHQILNSSSLFLDNVQSLAREIWQVAAKMGINLPEDLPEKTISVARSSNAVVPSMLQDARRARPMEIESLCGNICRQADKLGVPVPTVKMMYDKLISMNQAFEMAAEEKLASPSLMVPPQTLPHLEMPPARVAAVA
ncbi:2-dehydropantoate 2-reductase-like protein [Phyllosticta citricarpa]|uniref:2-dehydropantoate 2-reductase-like protein n=1 Tax=Phyllosticta citricarpa TaxID=55181 RepID=A0ABR1MJV7_9PEZI